MKTVNMERHYGFSPEDNLNQLVDIVKDKLLEHKFPLAARTDTAFLTKFIRGKKYNAEAAVASIKKYYDNIYSNLRLMQGIKPELCRDAYELNAVKLLKYRHNGVQIVYITMKNWDTKVVDLRRLEQAASFLVEELLQDVEVQVNGFGVIVNMNGFGFGHAKQFTYHEIKYGIKMVLEVFPVKVAGIHMLNTPIIFWPLHKIAMKLVPQKMQRRFHVHSDLQSLNNVIPSKCLPVSLGGILEEHEAWDTNVFSNILQKNACYDSYWNGAASHRPRRLDRKRSSIMMTS